MPSAGREMRGRKIRRPTKLRLRKVTFDATGASLWSQLDGILGTISECHTASCIGSQSMRIRSWQLKFCRFQLASKSSESSEECLWQVVFCHTESTRTGREISGPLRERRCTSIIDLLRVRVVVYCSYILLKRIEKSPQRHQQARPTNWLTSRQGIIEWHHCCGWWLFVLLLWH